MIAQIIVEFVFSFVLVNYFAQFSIKDFSSTFSRVTYVTELQKSFLAKNRTADHVLTLRTLIDKYLNCHKTKVYACFVHFRKAFDLVWHDGLFSLRSGRFEVVGTRKKRARERETREGKDSPHVSPARARSLFRPLLPSACYAGLGLLYKVLQINVRGNSTCSIRIGNN